ncbi:MAG: hypothetical protein A3G35_03120 [candidate division NC10 bacterium RIFCSPLOWO2_12_FULL_66_18]|nr:MAG: hypothetical protein A3H39_14095 [candidate division NC10 bacterium RIFCSPLOWO2_02_FULL_66_22]OGC01788.1 MAG: hypothetical protein A3G35_03120 [candidate division NC10 bacterium RIFCSPLOWO2_12_FULL_66_18]
MPTAWRITTTSDATRAFSGDGARLYGGRWNSKGVRVVYLADYVSAAALEQLVQVGSIRALPVYHLFAVTLPADAVQPVDLQTLPPSWHAPNRDPMVQAVGDGWVASGESLILRIPSAIVPHHANYLLNPGHPDFSMLIIAPPESIALDPLRRRIVKAAAHS